MSRRSIIIIIVFFVLLLASSMSQPTSSTTYSSKPEGSKAAYTFLTKTDAPVSKLLLPYSRLDKSGSNQVLFIVAPPRLAGISDLLEWAALGNDVVFYDSESTPSEVFREALGIRYKTLSVKEIDRILSSRDSYPSSCGHLSAHPVCKNVFQISPLANSGFQIPDDSFMLSGTTKEAFAAQVPIENGSVIYFSSPSLISNKEIDKHDNLQLLLNLTDGKSKIYFDEFHHGYTHPSEGKSLTNIGQVYLLGILICIILSWAIISRFIRFQTAHSPYLTDFGLSTGFPVALGKLYYKHQTKEPLSAYYKSWRKQLEVSKNISSNTEDEILLIELENKKIIGKKNIKQLSDILAILQGKSDTQNLSNSDIRMLENITSQKNI